jgi:TonB family protein
MALLALLLTVLLSPGQGRSPQARPAPPPPCVPGDPCCAWAVVGFCRVGCPPPPPVPISSPVPDVAKLPEPHPTGIAIVEIGVSEVGRVVSACVLRGVRPDFDRAAQEAALRSRWTPKLLNGRPVGVVMTVTYQFPSPVGWIRPRVTPRSALPITRGPVVFVEPTKACPKGKGGPVRYGASQSK